MQAQANTANQVIADAVAKVLADSHVIYMKARNFHWNVEGPQFFALHAMFEEQYTDIAEAMDEIAERIRALGAVAPGTSVAFVERASVKEVAGVPSAVEMVRKTVADYEIIGQTIAAAIEVAEAHGDDITAGLMADRLAFHQKQAWMMNAFLK